MEGGSVKLNKQKSDSVSDKVILLFVFAVVMLLMWWWFSSASSSQNKGEEVPASIFSHHVVNPSTLSVEYRVTNTTDKPGISSCSITMHDAENKYSGSDFDFKSAKEIQPGEEYSGIARLNISNDGAEFANKGKINCTIGD